jgi:hypothetical protein
VSDRTLSYVLIAIPALSLVCALGALIVAGSSPASFVLMVAHWPIGLASALALLGRVAVVAGSTRQLRTPWLRVVRWTALTLLARPVASALWWFPLGFVLYHFVPTPGRSGEGMPGVVVLFAIVVGAWTAAATAVLLAHRQNPGRTR